MGMGAASIYKGARITAASFLEDAPTNLTIAVNSPIAKVLLKGKKATGVVTVDGREYRARRDVILSGGVSNYLAYRVFASPKPYLSVAGCLVVNRFSLLQNGRELAS
jgi:hypothetical protein